MRYWTLPDSDRADHEAHKRMERIFRDAPVLPHTPEFEAEFDRLMGSDDPLGDRRDLGRLTGDKHS